VSAVRDHLIHPARRTRALAVDPVHLLVFVFSPILFHSTLRFWFWLFVIYLHPHLRALDIVLSRHILFYRQTRFSFFVGDLLSLQTRTSHLPPPIPRTAQSHLRTPHIYPILPSYPRRFIQSTTERDLLRERNVWQVLESRNNVE
jgi:hypothetical protein